MSEDDDMEDAGPRQIPWKKVIVVIIVVIVALAAYVEINRSVTSGEPFPPTVTVSGKAFVPQPATTAAIPDTIYFYSPNGSSRSASLTIQNPNYIFSITLQNRVNYTVQIGYHELVGFTGDCPGGFLNLQSHSANASYDASCNAADVQ